MSKPAFASDAPRRVLAVGLALFAIISRADTQPSSCLSAIEGLKSCSRTDGPCNAEAVVDALSPRPRPAEDTRRATSVYHLHLRKAGGTSMRAYLKLWGAATAEKQRALRADGEGVRVYNVEYHAFELPLVLCGPPPPRVLFVTMMAHPMQRMLSLYNQEHPPSAHLFLKRSSRVSGSTWNEFMDAGANATGITKGYIPEYYVQRLTGATTFSPFPKCAFTPCVGNFALTRACIRGSNATTPTSPSKHFVGRDLSSARARIRAQTASGRWSARPSPPDGRRNLRLRPGRRGSRSYRSAAFGNEPVTTALSSSSPSSLPSARFGVNVTVASDDADGGDRAPPLSNTALERCNKEHKCAPSTARGYQFEPTSTGRGMVQHVVDGAQIAAGDFGESYRSCDRDALGEQETRRHARLRRDVHLVLAKRVLESFDFVGVTSAMKEAVMVERLREKLGIPGRPLFRFPRERRGNIGGTTSVPERIEARFNRENAMDLELFSFACELAGLENAMFTPRRTGALFSRDVSLSFTDARKKKLADFRHTQGQRAGEHTEPHRVEPARVIAPKIP